MTKALDLQIVHARVKLERLLLLRDAAERRAAPVHAPAKTPRRDRLLDTAGVATALLLAWAILVPALHFFGRGVRDAATGCLIYGASETYASTPIGRANRVALMFATGAMVGEKLACHKCDRKPCIEPSHLYAGTFTDNNRDTRERCTPEPKPLPKFTTWDEWKLGGWRADGVKDPRDAEGEGFDVAECSLSSGMLAAIDRAPPLMAVEEGSHITNPDLWSEEDERSLMVLGCFDGHESKAWSMLAVEGSQQSPVLWARMLIRRPA